ncbi:MAG: ABC transporter ATP-binding protein [Planctomycetes bacterium]|nr:ABC transporter ATP-binding protein [Planctomycetota bacterium]
MIEVQEFSKYYAETCAVNRISFRVDAGEILGLVGPNGAGKTTTLRAIAGIIPPTLGHITIAGHDVRANPLAAKRELAFVSDEPRLFDYLTVREHLRFFGRLYGTDDVEPKATALIAEMELGGKEDALPGALSRGMKQKLAAACALLHAPKALLLDEPLTGLDPVAIRRMKRTIRARADAGTAVIVSSHLLSLVEEISNRVLVLVQGHIAAIGRMDELKASIGAKADLEEVFLRITGASEFPPTNPPQEKT